MPTDAIISSLLRRRTTFGAAARAAKRRWLRQASRVDLDEPHFVRTYHDLLLFMAAHPDEPALLSRVERELRRIERAVTRWPSRLARRLENSGIAGSCVVCSFSLRVCEWLVRRFGRDAALDWPDDADETLEEWLPCLVATVERDGLLCNRVSTREWVSRAAGGERSALAWLVGRFAALEASESVKEKAFAGLDLAVRWRLRGRRASRSLVRFPARAIHWQHGELWRDPDVRKILVERVPATRPLPVTRARTLLDACRAALFVRRREIDTLNVANEREVYLFHLEHGIDVAMFGMLPRRRLPIESYFGFIVARNRAPIGYGGGWVFMRGCEIGVNVFDEFRGGESAFAFAQVLRAFGHHFRIGFFTVDPFQFGADNAEAIRSGAYWFYDRLGFRPADAKTAQLADEERRRFSENLAYRSPASALRRLASARLCLDLRTGRRAGEQAPELVDIGLAVTRWIAREFAGDGRAAQAWAARRAARMLDAGDPARWPSGQRSAFERLSLLVAMSPALAPKRASGRRALVRLMRAKGGAIERRYALMMQSNADFARMLERAAAAGIRP